MTEASASGNAAAACHKLRGKKGRTQKMNKTELVSFVKRQTGIELENNSAEQFNKMRKVLYTRITRNDYNKVATLLTGKGFRLESHLKDYYFVYLM